MIIAGDSAVILKEFRNECIDLVVTSPPYDNLRSYGGHSFNFETISRELYRITKPGGVVVWIVGDATLDGEESLTSFKQALYFKEIGFKVYDTMIYAKKSWQFPHKNRYHNVFEYMFILSKGPIKTVNLIEDRQNHPDRYRRISSRKRESDNTWTRRDSYYLKDFGVRTNIWLYDVGGGKSTEFGETEHPAIMPDVLAQDHIKSWSNEGDLILDPFAGSGTTLKAAHQLRRKWIGIEINPDYVQLAKKRLTPYVQQQRLEQFLL